MLSNTTSAAECVTQPQDQYDTGHVMQTERYAGQCADTSIKRPAVILGEDANSLTFANLRHKNRWWVAKLPKHALQSVILAARELNLPSFLHGAHTELRFVLKPGSEILLQAQDPSKGNPDTEKLGDVMWSMEYVAPKGVEYSALEGQFSSYDAVDRIVSTADRGAEQIKLPGHPIQQWRLKFKRPEDADLLLQNAIRASNDKAFTQSYRTLTYNCTSTLFDLLDTLPDKPAALARYQMKWWEPFTTVRTQMLSALRARGLNDSQGEIATLNDELSAVRR